MRLARESISVAELNPGQTKTQRQKPLRSIFRLPEPGCVRSWLRSKQAGLRQCSYARVQPTLGAGCLVLMHEAFVYHGIDMRHGGFE